MVVFGVLRSSEWGWIPPKPDGPVLVGVSLTIWLILAGLLVVWAFFALGEPRLDARRGEPLVDPRCSRTGS